MSLVLKDFQNLLKLQRVDSEIDQLEYKRNHLPGHAEIELIQAEAVTLKPQLDGFASQKATLETTQQELEVTINQTRKRISEIESRLYDGSAKLAPNDALAMTHEIKHLKERQGEFEEKELEIMQSLEDLESELSGPQQKAVELSTRMKAAQSDIALSQSSIDSQIQVKKEMRGPHVAAISQDLMKIYEGLRTKPGLGGIAVAPLDANSCGGCHLMLAPTELAAIKKASESELIYCEECGRLLVRDF